MMIPDCHRRVVAAHAELAKILETEVLLVVVVYQCSISNVMFIVDIEALFVLVHAVLDC